METNTYQLNTTYNWAISQFVAAVYEEDTDAAKIAAVLAAICVDNESKRQDLTQTIIKLNEVYNLTYTQSTNINFDIQYINVYYSLTGRFPAGVEDIFDIYSFIVSKTYQGEKDNDLLGAILLLAQLGKIDQDIIPVESTALTIEKSVSEYLIADDEQFYELLRSIDAYTCFGLKENVKNTGLLSHVLEVRLESAIKGTDLQLISCILKALKYLGVERSIITTAAIKFLIYKQRTGGYFADPTVLSQLTGKEKRSYLLNNTLNVVIALKEQTNYRFYKKIMISPSITQQFEYGMVAL